MPTKTLKVKFQSSCVGCDLCVFEAQRQFKKVGFEGSLIRVLKNKQENDEKMSFYVELDPRINKLDVEKIAKICPKAVFEISEEETDGFSV